ncbi:MAG TPA: M56 family metallopeptidase [Gammaproteobacteria bacterium]|nr:M56 family metallopeptidase [Gammaproteobacteria bacterium]
MSALVETLLTAFLLSGLAAGCLVLLKRTPPTIRLCVAVAGLAAWVVPWGWIRIALPSWSTAAPLFEWLVSTEASALHVAEPRFGASTALGYVLVAAFVVGVGLFARDCVALRRCLRGWRARSRSGAHLRALLPPELKLVAADIRIVEGSAVAAASGILEPTIWLGDRHTEAQRRLSLVHEMWHVRACDPAWIGLIAAVRRAYWWNPLVAHLARQAVLMIESRCDHRCAAELGKADYVSQLASLLLAATAPAPRLCATIGTASLDVQRLRLLGQPLRVRARDLGLLVAFAVSGAATAGLAFAERSTPHAEIAPPASDRPGMTPGNVPLALLSAANAGDSAVLAELLGEYTPLQEFTLP